MPPKMKMVWRAQPPTIYEVNNDNRHWFISLPNGSTWPAELTVREGEVIDIKTGLPIERFVAAHALWAPCPPPPLSKVGQRDVTCAWCNNQYRSVVPDDLDEGLQGSHCAARVVQEDGKWLVYGGYGSDEHDMHEYQFVANPPTTPADPVCDECISERLACGDLKNNGLVNSEGPTDFALRPRGTWELVNRISELVRWNSALQTSMQAMTNAHGLVHPDPTKEAACPACFACCEYQRWQRWEGELDDAGAEFTDDSPEVTENYRQAARRLEAIATSRDRKDGREFNFEDTSKN